MPSFQTCTTTLNGEFQDCRKTWPAMIQVRGGRKTVSCQPHHHQPEEDLAREEMQVIMSIFSFSVNTRWSLLIDLTSCHCQSAFTGFVKDQHYNSSDASSQEMDQSEASISTSSQRQSRPYRRFNENADLVDSEHTHRDVILEFSKRWIEENQVA